MQQAAHAILSSMCKPLRALSNKVHNAMQRCPLTGNHSYAGHQSRASKTDRMGRCEGCLVLSLMYVSRQWWGILNDLVSILEICRFRYEPQHLIQLDTLYIG